MLNGKPGNYHVELRVRGLRRGKENRNYYCLLCKSLVYMGNGKDHGNYHPGFGACGMDNNM